MLLHPYLITFKFYTAMPRLKQPKKPRLGASDRTWKVYEKKMNKFVNAKNENTRRKELKDNLLGKIKI